MSQESFEHCAEILKQSDDYRVIKRFEPVSAYCEEGNEEQKRIGLYLDVETTGLNAGIDKIIELAMVTFEFLPDGRIFKILDQFNQFQDPGFPIPEGIVTLTGITDAMVKGQSIDGNAVNQIVDSAAVVIAHNAQFDRKFVESSFPAFESKAWACSIHDVPWIEKGVEGTKLGYIAYRLGFFFNAHRALNDCLAGVHILAQSFPDSDESILKSLLDHARQNEYRIWALGSPYDSKDLLKARTYRWNDGENHHPKSWYIDISSDHLQSEIDYLHKEIFGQEVELRIDVITAFDRYSNRTRRA